MSKNVTHLYRLEAEAIEIMREVVSEAENPVMLYSVGKDSAVMLHLAKKAFYPSPLRFRFCMWIQLGSSKRCINCATRPRRTQVWN